jgi:hypothetical protein
MSEAYRGFFAASVGASAAFIGLLFVALSFIDNAKYSAKVIAWRRIVASSSFSQLVNVFFVSLAGLLPNPRNLAVVGIVMAALGLIVSLRLLFPTLNEDHSGRTAPTALGLVAVGVYILEFVTAIGLLHNPNNQRLMDYLVLSIILLYAGALARAWEITGVKDR